LRDHEAEYKRDLARGRAFLDGIEVDPVALRAHGIKGKKKLVEALDAYYRFYQIEADPGRGQVLARVEKLVAVTRTAAYHDMRTVSDHQFKEDATSYLRAALLIDRMGLDDARYRSEIRAAQGRLDAHLKERGPHQRRAFHGYYQHFGLTEPFPLGLALEGGLIAKHPDPLTLPRADAYALTHEVFAAYDFGDGIDQDRCSDGGGCERRFDETERVYLRSALSRLVGLWQGRGDPDLVAELLSCMRYLGDVDQPEYRTGLAYLLASQNSEGTWGTYESLRTRFGDYVRQGFYLHTVMVVLDALTLAFEDRFRKREPPVCAP
jgi:hypothetical protein